MRDPVRDEIRRQWQAHLNRAFPARMRGEDIDGVDMVMIDADVAGCVSTWLGSSSALDAARIGILRVCRDELQRVVPKLGDPTERDYYGGLQKLANAVLDAQQGSPS